MFSKKQTQRIRTIFQFGTIWLVCGIVYSLLEKGYIEMRDTYHTKEIGLCELKGRNEKVKLFTLWK